MALQVARIWVCEIEVGREETMIGWYNGQKD